MFSLAEVFKEPRKIWDWVNVLDDTKLVSMISKCLLSFYHALPSAKPALTKSMRLWFQTWRYIELGLNFRKDLLIERMLQRMI